MKGLCFAGKSFQRLHLHNNLVAKQLECVLLNLIRLARTLKFYNVMYCLTSEYVLRHVESCKLSVVLQCAIKCPSTFMSVIKII